MAETCPAEFIDLAARLSDAARAVTAQYFRRPFDVETKPDESPVTIADREVEAAQRIMIETELPHHGIRGEEFDDTRPDAEYLWVLDPIDGTKAFVSGIPVFTNLIALLRDGEPILGVIDQPTLGERWIGAAGHGATFNGAPARCRSGARLADVTLHSTAPEMFDGAAVREPYRRLADATKYRRYGTDCYAYGLLASGQLDLVAEAEMKIHDYLPVVEVVRGAGGVITDWAGNPLGLASDGTVLAAADAALHEAALEALAAAG